MFTSAFRVERSHNHPEVGESRDRVIGAPQVPPGVAELRPLEDPQLGLLGVIPQTQPSDPAEGGLGALGWRTPQRGSHLYPWLHLTSPSARRILCLD